MAKLYSKLFIIDPTGRSDDWLEMSKTSSGKIIPAGKPGFDDDQYRATTQKTHQTSVQEATTYAYFAENHWIYGNKVRGREVTPYMFAIADWFGVPKVLEIDVDGWTGEIGKTIRIKARDNIKVARVLVVIRDTEENILEVGEAVQVKPNSVWWNYTTRSRIMIDPFPTIEATAQDLPGNKDSFVIS